MSSGNKTALGIVLLIAGVVGTILIFDHFTKSDVVYSVPYSFSGHSVYVSEDTTYYYRNDSAKAFWTWAEILYLWLALTLCYFVLARPEKPIFLTRPQGPTRKLSSRKAILLYGVIGTIVLLIVSGGYPRIDMYSPSDISNYPMWNAMVTRFEWSIIAIPLLWFALLLWHFTPIWMALLAKMVAPKPAPKIQPRRRVEKPMSKKGGIRILGGDDEQ